MKSKMKRYSILFILVFLHFLWSPAQTRKDTLDAYAYKGWKFFKQDRLPEAEKEWKKALSFGVSDTLLYNLGENLMLQKRNNEAVDYFKKAAEISRDKNLKARAWHNIGNIYFKKKQYQKAVEAYKNSLRNQPGDEETRYNYALAKMMLKKQKKNQKKKNKQNQNKKNNNQNKNQQNKKNNKNDKNKNKNQKDNQNKQNKNNNKNKNNKNNKNKNRDKNQQQKDKQNNQGNKKEDQNKSRSNKQSGNNQNKQNERKPSQGKRRSKLTPEQTMRLLQALKNKENRTLQKVKVRKGRGIRKKQDKDW